MKALNFTIVPINVGYRQSFRDLYYIRNQQDATLAVSFISHCKIE